MKKWISLMLVLVLMLSVASCAQKTEDPAAGGVVTEAKTLGFNTQYIRTDGYQDFAEFPQVAVVRSLEELHTYTEEGGAPYDLIGNSDFKEACKRYDAAYFAEQILVLVVLEEPSGSIRHKVSGVSLKGEELIIEIDRLVPEDGTDDMAEWHILVEPEAGIHISGAESVTVMIDGENATDPVIPTEYTSGYAHIDLDLPEGWEHELVNDDGSSSDFGIRFWPEGQAEGKIYVSYQIEGFGVCGTGLETEEITLGANKGSKGTYDEKAVWNYIWLKETAGTYVILNESAEIWWQQYGDEAMEILETLTVGKDCIAEEKALAIAKEKCTMEYHNVYPEFLHHQGAWKFTFRNNNTSETQEIIVENSGKVGFFLYNQAASKNLTDQVEPASVAGKAADETFIQNQMDLAMRLFQATAAEDQGKNILVSPLSIQLALAMTANGAGGTTRQQMETLLGGVCSIAELNEYLKGYTDALPSDEKYQFQIANSIWFRDDADRLTVERDFLQTNADYYGAQLYKEPFDDSTVQNINDWVSKHTDGMINQILDEIKYETVMYLINALAFDAEWATPYEKNDIWQGTFHAVGGKEQTVEMMTSEEGIYLEDDKASGFMKNYKGEKYSFAALLPKEGISLDEYVQGLTAEGLQSTLANAQKSGLIARMPKFSYDYKITMNGLLADLGMPAAFSGATADFTKMCRSTNGNVYIGEVLHKTFIAVDELGTKAGAVTSVAMDEESAVMYDHEVILDRPFLYMIIDNATNLPLFIGYPNRNFIKIKEPKGSFIFINFKSFAILRNIFYNDGKKGDLSMNAQFTGQKIAEHRKIQGRTQKDIAEALHVSVAAVSKWERGLNYPDLTLLEPLAKLLDISVAQLLGFENQSTEQVIIDMAEISATEKAASARLHRNRFFLFAGAAMLFFLLSWGALTIGREDQLMIALNQRGIVNLLGFILGLAAWGFGLAGCLNRKSKANIFSLISFICMGVSLYLPTLVTDLVVRFEYYATIEDTIWAYNYCSIVLLLGTVLLNICSFIMRKKGT